VDCGLPWSKEAVHAAVKRGNRVSAMTLEAIPTIKDEVDYQIKAGFMKLVPWDDIKDDPQKKLRISPIAVKPESGRWGRVLLDLSFPVKIVNKVIQNPVNEETVKLAPHQTIHKMVKVMNRQVAYVAFSPTDKPIYMSLWGASDGLWWLSVKPKDAWNFCYLYPTEPGEPLMIVAPQDEAQMGWTESP
jgi:hypothetical protein